MSLGSRRILLLALSWSFFFILAGVLPSQGQSNVASLSLERIFDSRDFLGEQFGPARWLSDGSGYTTVEVSNSQRALEIVSYDTETGKRKVEVGMSKAIHCKGE